jgi:hypothetical protein
MTFSQSCGIQSRPLRARAVTAQLLKITADAANHRWFQGLSPLQSYLGVSIRRRPVPHAWLRWRNPNSATWLTIKFLVLGVLLTSLLFALASQVRDWVRTK